MLKMRVHGLMSAGVTFFHVAPPFRVIWILPSSVPAHSTPPLRGEADRAVIVPRGVGVAPRDIGTDRRRLTRASIVARHIGAGAAEHDIGIAWIGRGDAVLLNVGRMPVVERDL